MKIQILASASQDFLEGYRFYEKQAQDILFQAKLYIWVFHTGDREQQMPEQNIGALII